MIRTDRIGSNAGGLDAAALDFRRAALVCDGNAVHSSLEYGVLGIDALDLERDLLAGLGDERACLCYLSFGLTLLRRRVFVLMLHLKLARRFNIGSHAGSKLERPPRNHTVNASYGNTIAKLCLRR